MKTKETKDTFKATSTMSDKKIRNVIILSIIITAVICSVSGILIGVIIGHFLPNANIVNNMNIEGGNYTIDYGPNIDKFMTWQMKNTDKNAKPLAVDPNKVISDCYVPVTCDCAKNTSTPCMAMCFEDNCNVNDTTQPLDTQAN